MVEPVAGFFAAVGVVGVAYLAAPQYKLAFSTAWFVLGALAAWSLVGPFRYVPVDFVLEGFEKWGPFAVTCGGGLACLVTLYILEYRQRLQVARQAVPARERRAQSKMKP